MSSAGSRYVPFSHSRGIPKTDIIQKNLEDFRDFNHDHLAKVKNLGQTEQLHDRNLIFGKNPKKADIWNVAQCIRGEATFKEAYEEPTLGATKRFGFRNVTKRGDEGRIFGVPSVRFDVSKPSNPSVANNVVRSLHQELWRRPIGHRVDVPSLLLSLRAHRG